MIRTVLLAALCALCACRSATEASRQDLTVAAAANLTDVFGRIGPQFEIETHIHPVFSFASTAQLMQQIENGAPFDLFAAADSEHVDELESKKLLIAGSRRIYARGVLALWIPPSSAAQAERLQDLVSPDVHVIAVAKPELAPYGKASVETLQKLGIWDQVKDRVVYAENINIARQYGLSKNADAVFTAYSLVIHEPGKVIPVEDSLHAPIDQELGIPVQSKNVDAARKFIVFLTQGAGRKILTGYGYR